MEKYAGENVLTCPKDLTEKKPTYEYLGGTKGDDGKWFAVAQPVGKGNPAVGVGGDLDGLVGGGGLIEAAARTGPPLTSTSTSWRTWTRWRCSTPTAP